MAPHRVLRLVLTALLASFMLNATAKDDTKARLKGSALVLMGRAEVLAADAALPLEGRRAVEAAQEWLEEAEENRKRRNFAAASRGQDNASLELEIADAHLRASRLATQQRELEAVVQELSEQLEAEPDS